MAIRKPPAKRKAPTRKRGRPTTYKPAYCAQLVEHMAEGLSIEAFAAVIGVAKKTLYNWTEAHEEFLHAKSVGEARSLLWWEKRGIELVTGIGPRVLLKEVEKTVKLKGGESVPVIERTYGAAAGSSGSWIFNMKNRFGWRDKLEHSGDPDQPIVLLNLKDLPSSGIGVRNE